MRQLEPRRHAPTTGAARRAITLIAALAISLTAAGGAAAVITPVTNDGGGANALAQALAQNPALVTGASFDSVPTGTPHATANSPIVGFPTNGPTFAIMTTGNSTGIEVAQTTQASTDLGRGERPRQHRP